MRVIGLREPVSFRPFTREEKAARKAVKMTELRREVRRFKRQLKLRAARQRATELMR